MELGGLIVEGQILMDEKKVSCLKALSQSWYEGAVRERCEGDLLQCLSWWRSTSEEVV